MDEAAMKRIFEGFRDDLIEKINSSKNELRNDIKTTKDDLRNEITATIKMEVKEVSDKVDDNRKEINDLKSRLSAAESKLYSEVVKENIPNSNETAENSSKENTKSDIEIAISAAKKKIGLKTDDRNYLLTSEIVIV